MSRATDLPLLLHVPYTTDRDMASQCWLRDPEAEDAITTTDTAAIRRLAAEGRLVYLPAGTQFTIEHVYSEWCEIRLRGQTASLYIRRELCAPTFNN